MNDSKKVLLFLCSKAASRTNKLSVRIANEMESLGIAQVGSIDQLSEQHNTNSAPRQMVFINDCRAGCVTVLTHGLGPNQFLMIDVSMYLLDPAFDPASYVHSHILPGMKAKWNNIQLPQYTASSAE